MNIFCSKTNYSFSTSQFTIHDISVTSFLIKNCTAWLYRYTWTHTFAACNLFFVTGLFFYPLILHVLTNSVFKILCSMNLFYLIGIIKKKNNKVLILHNYKKIKKLGLFRFLKRRLKWSSSSLQLTTRQQMATPLINSSRQYIMRQQLNYALGGSSYIPGNLLCYVSIAALCHAAAYVESSPLEAFRSCPDDLTLQWWYSRSKHKFDIHWSFPISISTISFEKQILV